MNITNDQQAFEYLKKLASDKGIDIAGAKMLGMTTVIFDPQYVKTSDLLKLHREKWKEYNAHLIPLMAGRTKINYSQV